MLAMDVWCFSKSTIRVDLEKHQTRLHYWGNSLCNFEELPLQLWVFLLCTKQQARLKSTYLEYVTALSKLDLLAIDDFGLMELDLDKCRDLFEVIDGRDGRRSTIIISQFPIKSWFDLFREHTYADACLARITDKRHSYRLEMNGISMREAEK